MALSSAAPAAVRLFAEKACDGCGAAFTPTDGRQKWCEPACRDRNADAAAATVTVMAPGAEEGAPGLDPDLLDAVRDAIAANAAGLEAISGRAWRSAAWGFAQELRDHPALADLDESEAADLIEPYLEAIAPAEERSPNPAGFGPDAWVRSLGDTASNGDPMNPAEDFLRVWNLVRVKALPLALRRADERPRYGAPGAFGPELSAPRRAPFRRFLAVAAECCAIARERTGEPVAPLATQAIADALLTSGGRPTERKTVAGWRAEAVARGFLAEQRPPNARGRLAGEYRWIAKDADGRYEPAALHIEGEEPGF